MKKSIIFAAGSLIILFIIVASGLSAIAADPPPSDAVIQQRIAGTWLMNWMILHRFTTIATNGDYAGYDVSNSASKQTNRFEGTIEIKNGLMIVTPKRTSITEQPAAMVSTNVIIRLTDQEMIFRAQDRSQPIMWERVK